MSGLTKKQREALDFIADYIRIHRVSPSLGEITVSLGLKSKSGAYRLVSALEERGFITRLKDRARSIRLVDADGATGKEFMMLSLVRRHIGILRRRCPAFALEAERLL